jgi:hypothetical protein
MQSAKAGQLYVGLCRAVSLEGLYLDEFDEKRLVTDKSVAAEVARLRQKSLIPPSKDGTVDHLLPLPDDGSDDIRLEKQKSRRRRQEKGPIGKLTSMLTPSTSFRTEDYARDRRYTNYGIPRTLAANRPTIVKMTQGLTGQSRKIRPWTSLNDLLGDWSETEIPNLRDFCSKNGTELWQILTDLRNLEPVNCNNITSRFPAAQPESVGNNLFPPLLTLLHPAEVMGDGNCLYRAVSLGLCGTQEYHDIFRALTTFIFLTLEEYFITLMKRSDCWAYNGLPTSLYPNVPEPRLVPTLSRNERRNKLHELIGRAFSMKRHADENLEETWVGDWGDFFHAHALGIALYRPIWVFMTGRRPGRNSGWIVEQKYLTSVASLRFAFENEVEGTSRTASILSSLDHEQSRLPIILYNSGAHWSTLIPRNPVTRSEQLISPTSVHFVTPLDPTMDEDVKVAIGSEEEQRKDLHLPKSHLDSYWTQNWKPQERQAEE